MSLRKSPTLTPALLASLRRNAQKYTRPRSAPGKAKSRLNRLRHGRRPREFMALWSALLEAPPGQVVATARRLLASGSLQHPLVLDTMARWIQVEMEMRQERAWLRTEENQKKNSFFRRSKPE